MKKSLVKALLFAIITLLLVFGLDAFLNKQMKELKYEDASVWNQIAKGGIDADVIIMGSSRAATHIDPQLISQHSGFSCYNLGMMGHNFFIEEARYRFYLQYNKAPKIILLSLDYESLQRRPDLFNHTQFIAYLDDTIIAKACKQYEGFSYYDYTLPLLKYVGEQTLIFSLFKNALQPSRNKPDRINGFYARDFHWDSTVDKILDTLTPYTVCPDTLSIQSFNRFIHYCVQNNIKLALIHTPTHPLGQAKVRNRDSIIHLYQQYAHLYQLPFLDYAKDSICNNKNYFMNATHLNKFGAHIFTLKLIHDLQFDSLLPQQKRPVQ